MMPVVRLTDATWARLESHAKGFQKPEDIVNLALDALDEKAGRLPAKRQEDAKPAKRGKRDFTPQKELRMPLLETLHELGGTARTTIIRDAMEKKIGHILKEADRETVSTGETRWWNNVCWERSNLAREGFIENDGERGVWKLSQKGKATIRLHNAK